MPRVIALDTHRQALRAAMPWIVLGLGPLAVSVAGPALAGALSSAAPAWIDRAAEMLGLIGSAALLLGTMQAARARVSGRKHPALVLAFTFWLAEFVTRLWPLQSDPAGASPSGDVALGVRLVASSASMACFAAGAAWILRHQQAGAAVNSWRRARTAFTVLTLAIAAAAWFARSAENGGLSQQLERHPFAAAAAWIVFAAPWALAVVAVRGTLRWLGRVRSTAEILAR